MTTMPVKRRTAKKLGGDMDVALQIFREMKALPCSCTPEAHARRAEKCAGCQRWWELEPHLRHALELSGVQ